MPCSVWGSVRELKDAGCWLLAALLAAYSGVLPLVKLLLLGCLTSIGADTYRSSWTYYKGLKVLAYLGKYALFDLWIVCNISIIVRIDVNSLPAGGLKDCAFWVQGMGGKGIFIFLSSILLSQLVSIYLLSEFRNVSENPRDTQTLYTSIVDASDAVCQLQVYYKFLFQCIEISCKNLIFHV